MTSARCTLHRVFTWRGTLLGAWLIAFALPAGAQIGAQPDPPAREITKITGNLYRFQNNYHDSVFLVTDNGVIATDPINAAAATWLKAEIKKRFNKPVRYVIYSHSHDDHASGGEVFADTATFVAHKDAVKEIAAGKYTPVPDITFTGFMTIELGGQKVELIDIGPSHSDNLIAIRFPAERTLFIVDVITVKRLPYGEFREYQFPETLAALDKLDTLDYDILAPGHGPLGTKADALDHHRYVKEIYAQVSAAIKDGLSLAEAQKRITMDAYKDWGMYKEFLPQNIAGLYRRLAAKPNGQASN
jgi:glyoxylase-like metal-dependent hydrolase (beta-lactamase superfamily II)